MTSVQTLPFSRFSVLKAKYLVGKLLSPVTQKAIEARIHAMITQLILFTANQPLNDVKQVFNLSLMDHHSRHRAIEVDSRGQERVRKFFNTKSELLLMLDLEKRNPAIEKIAASAVSDNAQLSQLLKGLESKKCAVRYKNFKAVYVISKDYPEELYPQWDLFERMLNSDNNTLKFYAIHVLANLTKIDRDCRFEKVFDQFYSILNGKALVPACHVAYVSSKIALTKPKLAERITEKLLNLDKATYKHKELVQANAVKSFGEYFDKIKNKEKVIALAEELKKSKSARAKKEACEFLGKFGAH